MNKTLLALASALVAAVLVLSGCGAGGGDGKDVRLTFLTAFPEKGQNNDGFWIFVEVLKEKAPWIEVDYRGGPEVVSPTDLIEDVSTGAYDGGHLPGDYYAGQMPLMELQRFTPYSPMEERENGVYDLLATAHEEIGVHYLGHTHAGVPQSLLLKDRIESPDLTGRSIRGSSAATSMITSLGGTPVDMPGDEVFTALERGVIDGTVWASVGPSTFGFHTEVGYYVEPRWYESLANTVISLDTWEALDDRSRQALTEAMIEAEPKIFEHYQKLSEQETAAWEEAGMERIEFTDADAEKMMQIAYRDSWDQLDWKRIASKSPEAAELRRKYEEGYGEDLSEAVPGRARIEAAS